MLYVGNESMSTAVRKVIWRKKASNRSNDFRLKAFLDFLVTCNHPGNHNRTPMTLLFGRILGLYPRLSQSIRPILGSITTIIFMLFYCGEKPLSAGNRLVFDTAKGIPSPHEYRQKLDKLSNFKYLPFKKVMVLLEHLIMVEDAHWSMGPLMATSVTISSRLPWEHESVSRLIHLLYHAIQGDDPVAHEETKHRSSIDLTNELTHENIHAEVKRSEDIELAHAKVSHLLPGFDHNETACEPNRVRLLSTQQNHQPVKRFIRVEVVKRLHTIASKAGDFWSALPNEAYKGAIDPASFGVLVAPMAPSARPQSRLSEREEKAGASNIHRPTQHTVGRCSTHHPHQPHQHNHHSHSNNTTTDPSTTARSSSSCDWHHEDSEYFQSARFLARTAGKGIFSSISFDEIMPLISSGVVVGPAELSIVCLAAWEAEYENILNLQESTLNTKGRRTAIKGTFDTTTAKISFPDRLTLKKILSWYERQFNGMDEETRDSIDERSVSSSSAASDALLSKKFAFKSTTSLPILMISDETRNEWNSGVKTIDWGLIMDLARRKKLPFLVSETLYNKSPAELNYHAQQIRLLDEIRRQQEAEEDQVLLDAGPYADLSYCLSPSPLKGGGSRNRLNIIRNPSASPSRRTFLGDVEKHTVSVAIMEDLQRREYLENQTLGSESPRLSPTTNQQRKLPLTAATPGTDRSWREQERLSLTGRYSMNSLSEGQELASVESASLAPSLAHSQSAFEYDGIRPFTASSTGEITESSVAVRTFGHSQIPGSRGSMFPQSLYPYERKGKHSINMADFIDIHPNLLAKVKMLKKNQLNVVDDELVYDEKSSIAEEIMMKYGRPHTADASMSAVGYASIRDKIMHKNIERQLYTPSAAMKALGENVVYPRVKHASCPTDLVKDGSLEIISGLSNYSDGIVDANSSRQGRVRRRDRNRKASLQSQSELGGLVDDSLEESSSLTLEHSSVLHADNPSQVTFHDSVASRRASISLLADLGASPKSLTRQFLPSFALEFTEYMKDVTRRLADREAAQTVLSTSHRRSSVRLSMNSVSSKNKTRLFVTKMTPDSFILRNIEMSRFHVDEFMKIMNYFLYDHVDFIQILDLTGLHMGASGSSILAECRLYEMNQIIELNIAGNELGDRSVVRILQEISKSDGRNSLRKLILKDNNISMANEDLAVLSQFINLRYSSLPI